MLQSRVRNVFVKLTPRCNITSLSGPHSVILVLGPDPVLCSDPV